MSLWESITSAFSSFKANKLRSGLSSLGIIIWVFCIVVLLSLWKWTENMINKNIENLWANLITILPWWTKQSDIRWSQWGKSAKDVLTLIEANLLSKLPNVLYVSPEYSIKQQIVYWSKNMSLTLYWVYPEFLNVRNFEIAFGNFITQDNVNNVEKVAILWYGTAKTLFWQDNPLGKSIRVWNTTFLVIWVMKSKWEQWVFGSPDDSLFVPLSIIQKRMFGTKYLSDIAVTSTSSEDIDNLKANIEKTLLNHFNFASMDDANFTVSSQKDLLESINKIMVAFTAFLSLISAVSLAVWWIWVMNILLVSVTERTREIWIRKALWAKTKDIILQFLFESVLLCMVWWLIWMFLSYLVVMATKNQVEGDMSPQIIWLWLWFSIFVWVVFGILPAWKASKLKPIDALRYE